ECRVALDHLLRIGTVDEVVVECSPFRAERQQSFRLMSDVEVAAEGVVEKNAVRDAVPQNDVERNGDINRVRTGVVTERVAVPHREAVAAELPSTFVERTVFLADAVNVFVVAEALPHSDRGTGNRRAALRVIFVKRLATARCE